MKSKITSTKVAIVAALNASFVAPAFGAGANPVYEYGIAQDAITSCSIQSNGVIRIQLQRGMGELLRMFTLDHVGDLVQIRIGQFVSDPAILREPVQDGALGLPYSDWAAANLHTCLNNRSGGRFNRPY